MFGFVKRIACLAVTGTLALGGLAGCGSQFVSLASGSQEQEQGQQQEQAQVGVASVDELYERYEANPTRKNYHCESTVNLKMSALGQSMTYTVQMPMDYAGEKAHAKYTMETMGQNQDAEMYMEKDGSKFVMYVSSSLTGDDTWAKTEADAGSLSDNLFEKSLFDSAAFEKTNDGYAITITGDKFFEVMSKSGLDMSTLLNLDSDGTIKKAIENSKLVYNFNKDCLPTKAEYILDFTYSVPTGSTSSSSTTVSADVKMNVSVEYSGYGTIDESEVTVPESVKKNAVDTGSTSLLSTSY